MVDLFLPFIGQFLGPHLLLPPGCASPTCPYPAQRSELQQPPTAAAYLPGSPSCLEVVHILSSAPRASIRVTQKQMMEQNCLLPGREQLSNLGRCLACSSLGSCCLARSSISSSCFQQSEQSERRYLQSSHICMLLVGGMRLIGKPKEDHSEIAAMLVAILKRLQRSRRIYTPNI